MRVAGWRTHEVDPSAASRPTNTLAMTAVSPRWWSEMMGWRNPTNGADYLAPPRCRSRTVVQPLECPGPGAEIRPAP